MTFRILWPSSSFSTSSRARRRRSSFFLFFSASIVLLEKLTDVTDVRSDLQKRGHDSDRLFALDRLLSRSAAASKHPAIVARAVPARKMSSLDASRDEDHVLAAAEGRTVEPAEAGLDDEPRLLEHLLPLLAGDPGERPRRCALGAADGEVERARVLVPVRALVDPGLAFEPAGVCRGDVVGFRLEDVEDQAPARDQQRVRSRERLHTFAVVLEMEVRTE